MAVAASKAVPVGEDRARRRAGVEVRVGLTTLRHRDDRPAELPGWGPVLPDVARLLVARQHAAEWRFAIVDDDGYLELAGLTRRRPGPVGPAAREARGGIVEIQIAAGVLAELAADLAGCGPWAGVVADLAGHYARRAQHLALLHARPFDRFVRAALRRHVQVRDRTCVAPGCRRPAVKADTDHTREHARGGRSVPGNSGPLCAKHHTLKHRGGWRLDQPRPGLFRWTSPLGEIYDTRGEPICPALPDCQPRPSDPEPHEEPASSSGRPGIAPTFDPIPPTPRRPRPPPRLPTPCPDADDPPPF